jgi:hypothetical protein
MAGLRLSLPAGSEGHFQKILSVPSFVSRQPNPLKRWRNELDSLPRFADLEQRVR